MQMRKGMASSAKAMKMPSKAKGPVGKPGLKKVAAKGPRATPGMKAAGPRATPGLRRFK